MTKEMTMRAICAIAILILAGCSNSCSKEEIKKLEQEVESEKESKGLHLGPSPIDR